MAAFRRLWWRQCNGRWLWTTGFERRTPFTTVDTGGETTVVLGLQQLWSDAKSNIWTYFVVETRISPRMVCMNVATEKSDANSELDVGPIFLTQPHPTHKWSDPTRPDPKLTWNSGPNQARPIYARLFVLPSAAESSSLSTFPTQMPTRAIYLLPKQHVLNVGINN